MYWHNAPRRIWQYNPDIKLIVILRNPIERAYSHWNMERSRNAEKLSFFDAIQSERDRCQEALSYQHLARKNRIGLKGVIISPQRTTVGTDLKV